MLLGWLHQEKSQKLMLYYDFLNKYSAASPLWQIRQPQEKFEQDNALTNCPPPSQLIMAVGKNEL